MVSHPISICIPSYNYGRFLGQAIASCIAQNADIEIIVLDNCSSDDTPRLREQFARDSRVKWFRNETVLPIHENWNKAISLATRKYTKLLHADDMLVPNCIEQMAGMIAAKPHVAYHGHLAELVDENGALIRKQQGFSEKIEVVEVTGSAGLRSKLNLIARFREPPCTFFLKEAWEQVGGYSNEFRFMIDVDFTITMLNRFPCASWNKYLVQLRRHGGSDGATLPIQESLQEMKRIVSKIERLMNGDFTTTDRAAGQALVLYKMLELFMTRFFRRPINGLRFLGSNANAFAMGPFAYFKLLVLLKNRLFYGDPQQLLKKLP
jgi:glycosyltransferase involved in cell wall biosynthesis